MRLTDEMKDALKVVGKGGVVVHLTTCNADGKCNTVGERFITVVKDKYILIADMFAQKTKVNLQENPIAIITVAHPVKDRTWAFRGPTTCLIPGLPPDYEFHGLNAKEVLDEWGNWAEKEPPDEVPPDIRPPVCMQRGLIAMKVEEVYSYKPDESGKKIL
ncbi:MAG: pyridoxamine 5'-phosphate oxidase [Nitrospirae bacterium]|nr:pyridoxamine 5'-phosphate oxidase [Nitrospirota bacterium]MCL5978483.1 pyridoxamine 5'-phosphate oxidase [Nitrospirota bacterium]